MAKKKPVKKVVKRVKPKSAAKKSSKKKAVKKTPKKRLAAVKSIQLTKDLLNEHFSMMSPTEKVDAQNLLEINIEEITTQAVGCCRYRYRGEEHCEEISYNQCMAIPRVLPGAVLQGFTRDCTCPDDMKTIVAE